MTAAAMTTAYAPGLRGAAAIIGFGDHYCRAGEAMSPLQLAAAGGSRSDNVGSPA